MERERGERGRVREMERWKRVGLQGMNVQSNVSLLMTSVKEFPQTAQAAVSDRLSRGAHTHSHTHTHQHTHTHTRMRTCTMLNNFQLSVVTPQLHPPQGAHTHTHK